MAHRALWFDTITILETQQCCWCNTLIPSMHLLKTQDAFHWESRFLNKSWLSCKAQLYYALMQAQGWRKPVSQTSKSMSWNPNFHLLTGILLCEGIQCFKILKIEFSLDLLNSKPKPITITDCSTTSELESFSAGAKVAWDSICTICTTRFSRYSTAAGTGNHRLTFIDV